MHSTVIAAPSSLVSMFANMFADKSPAEIRAAKQNLGQGEFAHLCPNQTARCFATAGLNKALADQHAALV